MKGFLVFQTWCQTIRIKLQKTGQGEQQLYRLGQFVIFCLAISFSCVAHCPTAPTEPPYQEPPSIQQLLESTKPKITSIQVPLAKIRIDRSPAGNFMFLAQQPERFSGQVQIAGKELLSLAFHENGYALRYLATKGLPPGFYEGTFSDCVAKRVLGLSINKKDLLTVVFGGIPTPQAPFLQVEQHWDQHRGQEIVHIKTGSIHQEIRFSWLHGSWVPAYGTQWHSENGTVHESWTVMHENFRLVGTVLLPQRTTILHSENQHKQKLTISYSKQIPEPDFLAQYQSNNQNNSWDEDDEGWENQDSESEDTSSSENALKKSQEPKIPAPFVLKNSNLEYRGELCSHPY